MKYSIRLENNGTYTLRTGNAYTTKFSAREIRSILKGIKNPNPREEKQVKLALEQVKNTEELIRNARKKGWSRSDAVDTFLHSEEGPYFLRDLGEN